MRSYFFVLAFILSFSFLTAQEFSIKGNLISNKQNEVIIGATIALIHRPDSNIVKGTYSKLDNNKNIFELKAKQGKYFLKISHLAFKEKIVNIDLTKDIVLNNILLDEKEINLDEIVVTGEKQYLELQLDKKVYNVSKDETNKGRNVSDLLDNIPSVTVDADGSVSLKGSEGVRILVDGKQSGLVGRDPRST